MINSRQEVQQYSDASELISFKNDRGLESYMCGIEDVRNIIAHLNNSAVQFGTVTPENNITSNNSQLYVDTSTLTLYANPTVGAVTGWIATT